RPQLRISAIRLSTVGGHVLRAAPGATVQSCASDPVYSVTFTYRWARMGIPGKELLRLDAPGTQGDVRSRTSLFEARGTNELVEAAEGFGVGTRALPAGAYRFEAKLDGVARTAAVTVTAAGC
ncbi:MAG TPA: hypothetical protein VF731_10550, partial [Solirubrobacterales bacterium]